MKERAVKEWPDIEMWRDPARPGLGLRFGLDFKNPTEGFPELMRYVPQQRVNALVEALEEIDASLIAQPDGTFKGYGALGDTLRVIKAHAAGALANYKEGEA